MSKCNNNFNNVVLNSASVVRPPIAQAKNTINNHLLNKVLTEESVESTFVNYRKMSASNPNNKVLINLPAESTSATAGRMSTSNPNNNVVVDLSADPTWDITNDDLVNPPPLMRDDSSDDENTEDADLTLTTKELMYVRNMSASANSGNMANSSMNVQRRMDFGQQKQEESAALWILAARFRTPSELSAK